MVKKPLEINTSCPPTENSMPVLIPSGTNVGAQMPEAHPPTDAPEQVVPIQDHSFPPETISGTVADSNKVFNIGLKDLKVPVPNLF